MRIQRGKSDRGEGERAKRAPGHPLSLLPAHEKSPALPETSNPTINRYRITVRNSHTWEYDERKQLTDQSKETENRRKD